MNLVWGTPLREHPTEGPPHRGTMGQIKDPVLPGAPSVEHPEAICPTPQPNKTLPENGVNHCLPKIVMAGEGEREPKAVFCALSHTMYLKFCFCIVC